MALAQVHVTLKPALFDAPGQTIKKALHQLGHEGVRDVRIGKVITLEIDGDDEVIVEQLDRMCRQLLANPVIEDYDITIGNADGATDGVTEAPVTRNPSPAPHADAVAAAIASPAVAPRTGVSTTGGIEAVASPGGVTDPFTLDFRSYQAMTTDAKISLKTLALRKYGPWIEKQLREQSAIWILCLGQEVAKSGGSIDSYPSDQELLRLGIEHNLVPWVFTRPQT